MTQSDGSIQNFDADFNQFDIYDLNHVKKPADDWIFYGDSITANCMVTEPDNGVAPFAQLIHQADSRRWPVAENGGEPFDTSSDAIRRILGSFSVAHGTGYLSIFPGRYVVLSYGMNDAGVGTGKIGSVAKRYYGNMNRLVRAVIASGRIPVVPTISYTNDPPRNSRIRVLNTEVTRLYKRYPGLVQGPDFWSYFRERRTLIGAGDIHPTSEGCAEMRLQWARTMLARVYGLKGVLTPATR